MSKHILFDENNVLSARYDTEVHGENIPESAIEVSDELFHRTINEKDGIWSLENDEVVKKPLPMPTAAASISTKVTEINVSCEAEMASISAGYPASEVLSWPKQEAEARAYTADNQAVTPLLDSLAAARDISKAELAGRIIAKSDLFAQVSGAIIGKRQSLEDQLDAISDGLLAEELEAPITPAVQALLDAVQWDPAP